MIFAQPFGNALGSSSSIKSLQEKLIEIQKLSGDPNYNPLPTGVTAPDGIIHPETVFATLWSMVDLAEAKVSSLSLGPISYLFDLGLVPLASRFAFMTWYKGNPNGEPQRAIEGFIVGSAGKLAAGLTYAKNWLVEQTGGPVEPPPVEPAPEPVPVVPALTETRIPGLITKTAQGYVPGTVAPVTDEAVIAERQKAVEASTALQQEISSLVSRLGPERIVAVKDPETNRFRILQLNK